MKRQGEMHPLSRVLGFNSLRVYKNIQTLTLSALAWVSL